MISEMSFRDISSCWLAIERCFIFLALFMIFVLVSLVVLANISTNERMQEFYIGMYHILRKNRSYIEKISTFQRVMRKEKTKDSGDWGIFHFSFRISYRIFQTYSEALLKMMSKLDNHSNMAKVTPIKIDLRISLKLLNNYNSLN